MFKSATVIKDTHPEDALSHRSGGSCSASAAFQYFLSKELRKEVRMTEMYRKCQHEVLRHDLYMQGSGVHRVKRGTL